MLNESNIPESNKVVYDFINDSTKWLFILISIFLYGVMLGWAYYYKKNEMISTVPIFIIYIICTLPFLGFKIIPILFLISGFCVGISIAEGSK